MAAKRYDRLGRSLGLLVVILSTIVGTSIFKALDGSQTANVRILFGVLSVGAAGLAGVQTFLSFPALAEEHRASAIRYGTLRRQVELLRAFGEQGALEMQEGLSRISKEWTEVDEIAPSIPQGILRKAPNRLRRVSADMADFRRKHPFNDRSAGDPKP